MATFGRFLFGLLISLFSRSSCAGYRRQTQLRFVHVFPLLVHHFHDLFNLYYSSGLSFPVALCYFDLVFCLFGLGYLVSRTQFLFGLCFLVSVSFLLFPLGFAS